MVWFINEKIFTLKLCAFLDYVKREEQDTFSVDLCRCGLCVAHWKCLLSWNPVWDLNVNTSKRGVSNNTTPVL